MIRFIDEHLDQSGLEAIWRAPGLTQYVFPTSCEYRAVKNTPVTTRRLHDELLTCKLERPHGENGSVYGVQKRHPTA